MDKPKTQPDLEVIIADPGQSFRWHRHSYPAPIAKWNYHPQYELHLITRSQGQAFIGDYLGNFGPGDLFLIGPSLPHNWVSNLVSESDIVPGRDVVLQFEHSIWGAETQSLIPELMVANDLLQHSKRGLQFTGGKLATARYILLEMEYLQGLKALAKFIELIDILATQVDRTCLSSVYFAPDLNEATTRWMQIVTEYVQNNFHGDIRLSKAAERVHMTDSTFSRFFKKNAGIGFSDYLNKLRIARACTLLRESELKIIAVCQECGYNNLSNFNRQFMREKGMTPTEYRHSVWRQLAE
ncbi:MAG: AraC family transcriptional regulator [Natronospirillum sp.]